MVAGGANIVQQYLGAGLVDEFQIHLVPVLMGGGVRLFDEVRGQQIAFHATRAIVSPSGVVHLGFADASRGDRPMVIS